MANNFRWFDQPAQYTPGGMEDYVAGKNKDMGYQKSQQGFLSLLGAGISGGIAPFVGDNQWLERRTKQQMEQAQADNEFRAALLKARQQSSDARNTQTYTFNPITGEYSLTGEIPKGSIVRNEMPIEQQIAVQQAKEQAKGVPTAEFGRVSLAKESIGNLEDVDKILFPKGNTESFRRDIAGASNLPLIGGPAPFNKEAQRVYRKLGSSLAARQLIQTGVAANEGERKQLANKFLANYGSDPVAFREGLVQLKSFYNDYQDMYKTKGINKDTGSNINTQGWNDQKEARLQELRKKLGK